MSLSKLIRDPRFSQRYILSPNTLGWSRVSTNHYNRFLVTATKNNLFTSNFNKNVMERYHLTPLILSPNLRHFKNPPNSFHNSKRNPWADFLEVTVIVIASLFLSYSFINWRWFLRFVPQPIEDAFMALKKFIGFKTADSLSVPSENEESQKQDNNIESTADNSDNILKQIVDYLNVNRNVKPKEGGFRERKIIEYENRIRAYSNPDKIFRYFATIKLVYSSGESEILMTPDDFLRSLTPGIRQPDGLGLDQFKRVDLSKERGEFDPNNSQIRPESIFYKLSRYGLINYSDFLFLLTVISVSQRHFEIAFQMFDLNGDGNIVYEEFAKVQTAILAQTSTGKKMGKAVNYKGVSSALSRYFFGSDLKRKLTIGEFTDFQNELQMELLSLEFERKNPNENGKIRDIDFAELLVVYAQLNEKKRDRMLRRVARKFDEEHNPIGINLQEYISFFRFLQNISDVDVALSVYNLAEASIDKATFKHVAKMVAHVNLTDHVIDVVFAMFDENDDGHLSNREFVSVMRDRLRRGLTKSKDTGLLKIIYTIWCALISFNT